MSMIGKTLGTFECTSLLGKGGMGEVYKAKDQKLGRDVAIKVLPEEFAKDADRVARFQREAKLLASLNHPNIAAIHGLEESDGTHFLVLELIEGDTLADRLKRGAIPVEEALNLALQIADALEAAHEKGVIHRDLKPANIKVTPDGKVKVLDFGLAKAFAGEQADINLSNSPTLSVAATQKGMILGTAAYMSPEQASGEATDKRTDIWAFGVVLFEMLTGRSLFEGNNVSQTLASVIKSEPEWQSLPPNIHPRIRLLLERCLEKDVKNRCSGISDARVEIQKVLTDPSGMFAQPSMIAKPRKKLRVGFPWVAAIAVLCLIVAGVAIWILKPTPPPEPKQVTRFEYELPDGQQFGDLSSPVLAVSPDGKQFVYGTTNGLYLRSVNELNAKLIAGTEGIVRQPFFSPDGKSIGYFSWNDLALRKILISGGTPVTLCAVSLLSGAWWDEDNTIVYGQFAGDMMRISGNGGTPQSFFKRASEFPIFPQLLPDGKSVLYTADSGNGQYRIMVGSLKSGEPKELFAGYMARYLSTGHIIYELPNNNLFAVPFDLDTLEVKGGPAPVVEGVNQVAVSDAGTLAYIPEMTSGATQPQRTLVWVDLEGKEQPIEATPDFYSHPSVSPDGARVALRLRDDIYVWDMGSKILTRLTFKGTNMTPLWTPDGKRIVFASIRGENDNNASGIYWKAADGAGEEEQLVSFRGFIFPYCWSSDGKTLIGSDSPDGQQFDIWTLSLDGDRVLKPLLYEDYLESQPRISPNGRWIAYFSNESGMNQVYVRPFPDVNKGLWEISPKGGDTPLWLPNGRELLYLSGDAVMSVSVTTEPNFSIIGSPQKLFQGPYACPAKDIGDAICWDNSPDGKRFLMIKLPGESKAVAETQQQKIIVVTNWFEELKELVPLD